MYLPRLNTVLTEVEHQGFPPVNLGGQQPGGVFPVGVLFTNYPDALNAFQFLAVKFVNSLSVSQVVVKFFHSGKANARRNVRHLVLVPYLRDVILPNALVFTAPVNAEPADPLPFFHQFGVFDEQHAAVPGGQVLDCLKRKHGKVALGTDDLAFVGSPQRVGRILNDFQVVFFAEFPKFVHLAGQAAIVYAHNGLRFWGDELLDVVYVNVEVGINVGKHDFHAHVQKRDIGGRARKNGGNDLIARLESRQNIGKVQGVRARPHGQSLTGFAEFLLKLQFKLFHFGTLTNPAGGQYLRNSLRRVLRDVWIK